MFVRPSVIKRRAPWIQGPPGFYLIGIDHSFNLAPGRPVWLGLDPVAGIRAFASLGEGYYAILRRLPDEPQLQEWGTLCVWCLRDGRERWRLRSLEGRPVAVPGAVIWDGASLPDPDRTCDQKGGMPCRLQG